MKRAAVLSLKIVALAAVLFVCFAFAGQIAGVGGGDAGAPEGAGAAAAALLIVCLVDAAVLAFVVLRSRWHGWRLAATLSVVLYGVMTVMSQIETAVFVTRLPEGVLPRLFVMGAIVAAVAGPAAVLVFGKTRPDDGSHGRRLAMPAREWGWKLAVIAASYVILYFTFGYFVAWRSPAVREYYGGTDPGSFLAAMRDVMRDTPWLPAFQLLRGLLWAALAIPVIRMTKGDWWEAGLAVALLFGVVMNTQLLLPNPYMPEAVRIAHLVETASSNFLFAWLLVWLLTRDGARPHAAAPRPRAA